MDISEMVILDEHAAAVAVASEALDLPMQQFNVRVYATTRMHAHTSLEAIDMDHAKQLVMLIDPDRLDYELEDQPGVDGDEVAFVELDDGNYDEEQVDIKLDGEPYSWDACELVKELAKVEPAFTTQEKFNEFIEKARELCAGGRKPLEKKET